MSIDLEKSDSFRSSSLNRERDSLLPLNNSEREDVSKSSRCYSNLIEGGIGLASMAGITLSAVFLMPLLNEIANHCFKAEMETQDSFNACYRPQLPDLILYHSILAISCLVTGYLLKRRWEEKRSHGVEETKHTNLVPNKPSMAVRMMEKVKYSAVYIEKNYSYEILLFTAYLYNGIGIKVVDPSSFHGFLACSAAMIGIASSFIGIYARNQFSHLRKDLTRRDPYFKQRKGVKVLLTEEKELLISTGISAVVLGASYISTSLISKELEGTLRELSFIFVIKPIGFLFNTFLSVKRENSLAKTPIRSLSLLKSSLRLHSLVIISGYTFYFFHLFPFSKYLGLGLLGFTLGVRDSNYNAGNSKRWIELKTIREREIATCVRKVSNFVGQYWKLIVVVGFEAALYKFRFLDCVGPPSPLNFSCPVGLETSVYLAGNQVVVDSLGLEVAIGTGLTHFYLYKLSYFLEKKIKNEIGRKVAGSYRNIADRYQLDLLTLIPFTLFKSGRYVEQVKDFYAFNPYPPLVLTAITLATHKQQLQRMKSEPESLEEANG